MQIQIMETFQSIFENCHGFFDVFFAIITAFGEEMILFIVLPIFYWAINKEVAQLIAVAGFASLTLNGVMKDSFKVDRPMNVSETIRYVEIDNFFVDTVSLKNSSYSFPSGHAQTISTLMFSFSCYYKSKKLWTASIVLVLLVMLSRMYLGVHWPLDVVVGAVLGLVISIICYKIFIKMSVNKRINMYVIVALISVFALIFASKADTFKAIGAGFGFATGAILDKLFLNFDPKDGSIKKKIIRCVVGIIFVLGLRILLKSLFSVIGSYYFLDFLRYFIVLVVSVFGCPWVFKKINM